MTNIPDYKRAPRGFLFFLVLALSLLLFGCMAARPQQGVAGLSELQRLQADQTTTIASVRQDIRELIGRIDELEHRQNELYALSADIKKVESRLPPPEGVPLSELNSETRQAEQGGDDLLLSALNFIRKGNFPDAISSLENAIKNNGSKANYLYWLGVANENYGYLEKSLGAYHEASANYPKHALAPAALMKQADVFVKLADKQSAKLTLQKIISSYPSSSYATLAKSKLKIL